MTKTDFKTYFKGSEYVIAGKLNFDGKPKLVIKIDGQGEEGQFVKTICFGGDDRDGCDVTVSENLPRPPKSEAENFIERLWAYLTIKNLLDENVTEKSSRKKAEIKGDIARDLRFNIFCFF